MNYKEKPTVYELTRKLCKELPNISIPVLELGSKKLLNSKKNHKIILYVDDEHTYYLTRFENTFKVTRKINPKTEDFKSKPFFLKNYYFEY